MNTVIMDMVIKIKTIAIVMVIIMNIPINRSMFIITITVMDINMATVMDIHMDMVTAIKI